ncbi:hypothetical protein AB0G79_01730 [Streptomyces sp. NPDC020807]|uniref:hypothetical protein n=1 Tax=Streptomyces sp. NPDC020807 TaxID=3155119 RepID=UPI0033E89F96
MTSVAVGIAAVGLVAGGAVLPPHAVAGGVGDGSLKLVVTVNGRADSAARPPAVRVGAEVVKRYRLLNRGEAHLYGVRVVDPAVPEGAVRCTGRTLAALGQMVCVARFRALGGEHRASVRAEGEVPSLRRRLTTAARSGYAGVVGGLRLSERVVVAPRGGGSGHGAGRGVGRAGSGLATVTYVVTNLGNREVHGVRVTDPALGLTASCGGPGRRAVPPLAPGASARCTATVRRPYGTHRSTGLASGSDLVRTYAAGGQRLPAPTLTARSSAVFTLVGPQPPRAVAPPRRPKPARPGSAGAPGGRAVPGQPAVPGTAAPGGATAAAGAPAPGVAGAPEVPGAAGVAGGAVAEGAGVAGAVEAPVATAPQAAPLPVPERRDTVSLAVGQEREVARHAALDDEGFLGRLRRRSREGRELGVVVILLLMLIPAAVAAALLGSRRS